MEKKVKYGPFGFPVDTIAEWRVDPPPIELRTCPQCSRTHLSSKVHFCPMDTVPSMGHADSQVIARDDELLDELKKIRKLLEKLVRE